jgi:hypothetical protein
VEYDCSLPTPPARVGASTSKACPTNISGNLKGERLGVKVAGTDLHLHRGISGSHHVASNGGQRWDRCNIIEGVISRGVLLCLMRREDAQNEVEDFEPIRVDELA